MIVREIVSERFWCVLKDEKHVRFIRLGNETSLERH
jgi:hypothetical protein